MKTKTCTIATLLAFSLINSRAQDTWTEKADFGGNARFVAVGFSIGSKGYIGTGLSRPNVLHNDFWEYDPATDAWTQKADFGGTARNSATGFSIGSKGYIGTGGTFADNNDFWEYDPATDAWTQKASVSRHPREYAVGFSIGNKGYIGTGYTGLNVLDDFWEYDPARDAWRRRTNFGGAPTTDAVGFSIDNKGYITTGSAGVGLWEYDPSTNVWTPKADFAGSARKWAVGFNIGGKGYIGTGLESVTPKRDFWEYTPGESGNLSLLSAASVKQGGFAIDLPLTGSSGVEDRSGDANKKFTVVMTFNQNIVSVGDASSTCGGVQSIVIDSSDAHKVNINLVNVARACNGSTITITANSIADDQGDVLDSASVSMGLLLGDVNGDRVVNAADNQEAQSHKGQWADSTNFRSDVNANGHIEHSDIHLIQQQNGTSLPP